MRPIDMRAVRVAGAFLSTTALAAAPAAASAQTATTAGPSTPPIATKASAALRVTHVRRTVIAGRKVVVRGRLAPAGAGRAVALQVSGSHGRWITVDHARTASSGAFRLSWTARRTGTKHLRVDFGGTRDLASARYFAGIARIYRPAVASWYGPGFYGGHLACGGTLTAGTLGVAHKTLPCGTKVTLHYHGRTVRVPVIDRGPYVSGREFDLTAATKARLGFGSTGVVLTTA